MMTEDQKMVKTLRRILKEVRLDANNLHNKVVARRKMLMWTYPKEKLNLTWTLQDLYQRAMTAHTLGWDVVIEADESGINVRYVEKLPIVRPNSFY
jgi:hypothetical protein